MITDFQADVLAHTSKNDRYVTDEVAVIEMGKAGLLFDYGPQAIAGGMHCLVMTGKGRVALREWREAQPKPSPPPKLTRRQERAKETYEDFRRADSGMTFGEWLKGLKARQSRRGVGIYEIA